MHNQARQISHYDRTREEKLRQYKKNPEELVGIFQPNGPFYYGKQIGAPIGNIIILDTPLDFTFDAGVGVLSASDNMAVDGSGTTQIFQIGSARRESTIDLDITIDQAIQFIVSCGVVIPPNQLKPEDNIVAPISSAVIAAIENKPTDDIMSGLPVSAEDESIGGS